MSTVLKFARVLTAATVLVAAGVLADEGAKEAAKVKTEPAGTTGTPEVATVGQKAPDFMLKDTDGKVHTLKQYLDSGKIVVLSWFNANCPFIIRHYEKYTTFTDLDAAYNKKKVVFVDINSTNRTHPQFGGDSDRKKKWGIKYDILLDSDGKVGKLYGAKTTPHNFVITPDGVIRYSGAIDNDPQDEKPAKEKLNYVHQALDELLAGKPVSVAETRPYGCSVKYSE